MEPTARYLHAIAGGIARVDSLREQRFAEFVTTHRERAIGLAWRLVGGDGAAAEDVAQEAFARAWRGLDRFRGDAELSTWFHRVLVNEANRFLRWRWVRRRFGGDMPDDPADPRRGQDGDLLLRRRIARAVTALARGQREAFVLVHLEGMSIADAATVTGRAEGTIKSQLHRALAALRTELADLDPVREESLR